MSSWVGSRGRNSSFANSSVQIFKEADGCVSSARLERALEFLKKLGKMHGSLIFPVQGTHCSPTT